MSCPSPPPPLPSPVLVPAPLPSPPPLARKHSPRRVSDQGRPSPPIPADKTLVHARSHDALPRTARARAHSFRRLSPARTIKRSVPSRCRSPPPSPAIRSPPPPVPPIPAFLLATNHSFVPPSVSPFDLDLCSSEDHIRCGSYSEHPLNSIRFFAVHNAKGECRA